LLGLQIQHGVGVEAEGVQVILLVRLIGSSWKVAHDFEPSLSHISQLQVHICDVLVPFKQ
jgi:hypothetical protein